MVPSASTSVVEQVTPDAELFAQFLAARDEQSFAALAERYTPLVWQVCARVTGQRQDAEDAFQQTFCVLARRADRVRRADALGSWLYGVAYRTSLRVRSRCRARHECELAHDLAASANQVHGICEQESSILHEELNLLPRKYREPLVQRYLLDRSVAETGQALALSTTVVKGRLQRARNELRARLAARGIVGLSLATLTLDTFAPQCQASSLNPRLMAGQGGLASGSGMETKIAATGQAASRVIAKEVALVRIVIETASVVGCVLAVSVGLPARSAIQTSASAAAPTRVASTSRAPLAAKSASSSASIQLEAAYTEQTVAAAKEQVVLKYDDNAADGKKSMAGTGEMIHFTAPADNAALTGIELHGSRYGHPQAPREDFKIYLLSANRAKVLHTEMVPYNRFERGEAKWVTLKFAGQVDVPREFWIVVDFNAEATKGVYVSYDSSTGGEHSMIGLPGKDAKKTNFGGDWMIRARVEKK